MQSMGIIELEHSRAIKVLDIDRLVREADAAEPTEPIDDGDVRRSTATTKPNRESLSTRQ